MNITFLNRHTTRLSFVIMLGMVLLGEAALAQTVSLMNINLPITIEGLSAGTEFTHKTEPYCTTDLRSVSGTVEMDIAGEVEVSKLIKVGGHETLKSCAKVRVNMVNGECESSLY